MLTSLALVGLLLTGQPAPGGEALKSEVDKLVRQLNVGQLVRREEAEKKLLALGPAALDHLPEVTDNINMPEEVKQRLGRIRQKLQQTMAEAAARASAVTLKAPAMPLSKILSAFTQQTGNRLVDKRQGAADPELKVNFEKTPFWPALDRVLDQAGLTVYPFAEEAAVCIVPRPATHLPRSGRAAYSGPFRIEPVRVMARRELRNAVPPALVLTLETSWEPRLRPIGLKQRMADLKVLDDHGNSLAVDDPQAEIEALGRGDAAAVEIELPLLFPPRPAKEITSLKGTLQAIVPGKVETFRFGDLLKAKNIQKRIAGVTVTLEQVRKNDNLWEVRMAARFDQAGDALDSHRNWVLQNEAYLEGPDGKPIACDTSESTRRAKDEIGMAYLFSLDQPPAKLNFVYKTPGTIVTTSFPYELKGIKLP